MLTPTWQGERLPSAPQYCRETATDWSPDFGNEVSSITHASGVMAEVIFRAIFRSTGTWSHGDWLTNCCRACMLPSGSRPAIGWMDLRRPSSISPRR